jgi:hypothetical protein
MECHVGTDVDSIAVSLGPNVTFDDGKTESQKLDELLTGLSGDSLVWALDPADSIRLDVTWAPPTVDYARDIELDLSGGVYAQDNNVQIPAISISGAVVLMILMLATVSVLVWRRRAGGKVNSVSHR